MGQEITRALELFNSPVEVGLRCLLIINQKRRVNLEQLVMFDYLCLNTNDFDGPPSIHAPVPHRSVQILVRREMIKTGLRLLISKELVSIVNLKSGLYYSKTKLTSLFLNHLTSEYRMDYQNRLEWVLTNYGNWSEEKLGKFINSNNDKLGGALATESNYTN